MACLAAVCTCIHIDLSSVSRFLSTFETVAIALSSASFAFALLVGLILAFALLKAGLSLAFSFVAVLAFAFALSFDQVDLHRGNSGISAGVRRHCTKRSSTNILKNLASSPGTRDTFMSHHLFTHFSKS